MGLLLVLRDVAIAAFDAMRGQRSCRYEHRIDIAASRETVWALLMAADVTFNGVYPLRIVTDAVPGRRGVLRMQILAADTRIVMLERVVEERDRRAVLYIILTAETDPMLVDGEDDYFAFVLEDIAGGTHFMISRKVTVKNHLRRLTVPAAVRSGAARLKRKAEEMERDMQAGSAEPGSR